MAGNKTNKNRKYEKNKKDPSMKAYNATGRLLKNKARSLMKAIKASMKKMARGGKLDEQAVKLWKKLTGKKDLPFTI